MIAPGPRERRKWIAVGALLSFLALLLWHLDSGLDIPGYPDKAIEEKTSKEEVTHHSEHTDKTSEQPASKVEVSKPGAPAPDLPHIPQHLFDQVLNLAAVDTKEVHLISDLHNLKTNAEFIPYIAGISNVRNLSVADAYGTCDYKEEELSSFKYHADADWVREPLSSAVIDPLREAWQYFVKNRLIPWDAVKQKYEGRGIVIVGGGSSHDVNRIKAILRALNKHGSKLPVEINYFGDELKEPTRQQLTAIYGSDKLFFNDLSDSSQTWVTFKSLMNNYQLKTAGLINARFAEMLLLDADNIPTSDPAALFDSKAYKEYGSVFWPDYTRTRKKHPAWAAFNTLCRRDEYEFETGQVLVDKRRYFYHLQLAAWMNTQDYWRKMLLGDKDLFRYAWHALKTGFGRPVMWLTSLGFVAEQADGKDGSKMVYCGHTFGQAHPDHSASASDKSSGISFLHGGALKTMGAPLLARLRKLNGGIFTHFKRVKVETLEDWSKLEYAAGTEHWSAGYYYNLTSKHAPSDLVNVDKDFDLDGQKIGEEKVKALELTEKDAKKVILCMNFGHVEARPIAELGMDAEGFEGLFEGVGGYWAIEDNYRGW